MNIIETVKKWFHGQTDDHTVYGMVAGKLRTGSPAFEVHYHGHYNKPRYYTGSGERNGSGLKARWNMDVHKFVNCEDGFIRIITASPTIDHDELKLLQTCDTMEFKVHQTHGLSTAQLKETLINIARRLKPGQGYKYRGVTITQDLIHPDGYQVHMGMRKLVLTEDQLALPFVFDATGDDNFDPKGIFVFDQTLIKRQHRPLTDPKRWIVTTQVNSIEDDWVISYTHYNTAGAQITYYGLDIVIDAKSMKRYPFYITELVNATLTELKTKHADGYYDLRVDKIKIQWDGNTYTLNEWLAKAEKFPAFKDNNPVVIFKELNTRASWRYGNGFAFLEIKNDPN